MAITATGPRIISRPRDERDPNFAWFGFRKDRQHVFVRSSIAEGIEGARAMFAKCEPEYDQYAEVEDGQPLVIVGHN